jgi:hypothetical protein
MQAGRLRDAPNLAYAEFESSSKPVFRCSATRQKSGCAGWSHIYVAHPCASLSDLLGVSSRRMLHALAAGETEPAKLAALADPTLRRCGAIGG